MKARFENFFRQRMGLAIAILLFAVMMLVFVMPKIYISLDPSNKKAFWGTFLLSFGILMFVFFGKRHKKVGEHKVQAESLPTSSSTPRSYQKLLDEVERCIGELRTHRRWGYSCLMMGWIILWIGKWSGHPPYNHPIFALPVFMLALLGATRSIEKENELDVSIANCTIEGIGLEKSRPGLKSSYFQNLASSYRGSGMCLFALIRISPPLTILCSLLSVGPLSLLTNHFFLPRWTYHCASSAIVMLAAVFLARTACRPYYWLLGLEKNLE